jgi:hypothetical protein
MELRHHPLMNCGSIKNWPPAWAQAMKDGGKTAEGEIGILKYALTDRRISNKCFLVIEHGNERYNATLSFTDAKFFLLVTHVLKNHVGRTIKEIGDLDLSSSL